MNHIIMSPVPTSANKPSDPSSNTNPNMTQELQIKATILDIESKTDKNTNPYFRITLANLPQCYFYAFSFNLPKETLATLTNAPHNFINRQVLITYQELPNKDNQGVFCKVQQIQIC